MEHDHPFDLLANDEATRMWQRAKFLPPTSVTELFWVLVEPPTEHDLPALKESGDGFESETIRSFWYRTNVLEPHGHFFMWAPKDGVELLSEFAPDVEPDKRYLLEKR